MLISNVITDLSLAPVTPLLIKVTVKQKNSKPILQLHRKQIRS
jgi:hypothetical protein